MDKSSYSRNFWGKYDVYGNNNIAKKSAGLPATTTIIQEQQIIIGAGIMYILLHYTYALNSFAI